MSSRMYAAGKGLGKATESSPFRIRISGDDASAGTLFTSAGGAIFTGTIA